MVLFNVFGLFLEAVGTQMDVQNKVKRRILAAKLLCCLCFQVILHQEGHMDDALTVSRSQTEESQAARMIYSTTGLFRQFIKYVHKSYNSNMWNKNVFL